MSGEFFRFLLLKSLHLDPPKRDCGEPSFHASRVNLPLLRRLYDDVLPPKMREHYFANGEQFDDLYFGALFDFMDDCQKEYNLCDWQAYQEDAQWLWETIQTLLERQEQ